MKHHLDEEIIEQIFKTEYKNLCFFALQYVKDLDTARELVQDAFIRLWEKKESIDPQQAVKAYLATTVRNLCLNYLRDNRKFNRDVLEFEGLAKDHSPAATTPLLSRELEQMIQQAIEGLPEKCREIFVMNRYQKMKYQEIADKLGISVKTVEGQMSKALSILRERLKDYLLILVFTGFDRIFNN